MNRVGFRTAQAVVHAGHDSVPHFRAGKGEVVGGAGSVLKEAENPTESRFELLRRQSVERRRSDAGLDGPDGVGGVIGENCLPGGVRRGGSKRQDRKFGVERAGRSHELIARSDPVDLAVGQPLPAVLTDGFLFPEVKMKDALFGREAIVGRGDGVHDALLHAMDETEVGSVPVDLKRAGSVMRVSAIDEKMGLGDARGFGNLGDGGRERFSRDHENVQRDNGQLHFVFLEDNGSGA